MAKLLEFIATVLIIGLIIALPTLLFMVCFNYVAPVFYANSPQLTFIQALAAVVIAKVIFGTFIQQNKNN